MSGDLRRRIERLETAAARTADDGPVVGSWRFWWTLAGQGQNELSDADRAEWGRMIDAARADRPDPVEEELRRIEAVADAHQARLAAEPAAAGERLGRVTLF